MPWPTITLLGPLAGGYEPIAPILFAKENVDAYYLEFDDDRSGGFEPLREVSPNKESCFRPYHI